MKRADLFVHFESVNKRDPRTGEPWRWSWSASSADRARLEQKATEAVRRWARDGHRVRFEIRDAKGVATS